MVNGCRGTARTTGALLPSRGRRIHLRLTRAVDIIAKSLFSETDRQRKFAANRQSEYLDGFTPAASPGLHLMWIKFQSEIVSAKTAFNI
jgi:hypothetical protein